MHDVPRKCLEKILRAKNQASMAFENHTPGKPEFKIGCQKKLFSKANETWFLARRIFSKHFLSTLCM